MATLVKKTNVKRVKGRLYFIDKSGNVASTPRGKKGRKLEEKTAIKKEKGYFYYLKGSDVYKMKPQRGGKKKKKK